MPETIQEYKGKYRWPMMDMINDLVEQGGLKDEDIEVTQEMELRYKGQHIIVTHDYKEGLILSSSKDLEDLVQAFSKVLNLEPFCRYTTIITLDAKNYLAVTYEWNKKNPMMRYFDLMNDKTVRELREL